MESRRLRQLLLDTIGSAREREHEFLALFDDKPPPEPGLWTVKDHLAHLTAWRTNVEQLLDSVRTGTEAPKMDEDVQASNARVYSATLLRFKVAFDLDPSLKTLAQTDAGQERIRNHPELAALIAQ